MSDNSTTDQPTIPPAGDADPRAASVPANSNHTYVTVTQVKGLKSLSPVELDAYIQSRALRCSMHVNGFRRRATELYTALIEMERRYNKQQGARSDLHELPAKTWTEYVESSGINPATYRKWKSRLNNSMRLLIAPDGTPTISSGAGVSRNPAPTVQTPVVTADDATVVDALSALANLGYKSADAKQAVDHALTADPALANDLSGLIRAALAKPSTVKATSVDDDPVEAALPALTHTVTPALTRRVSPSTPTPVVSTEEKDREQLCFLAKRLNSIGLALQQVLDKKAKWSKYPECAEVVTLGEKLANLVKLLSEPEPDPDPEPTPKPTTDDATLTAEEMAETKAWADKRKADNAAYRTTHTCHLCGKQFKRKYHSAKRHETTYKHDDESTCVVMDGKPTNIRLMAAAAELKAQQEREAAWQAEYVKEEGPAK